MKVRGHPKWGLWGPVAVAMIALLALAPGASASSDLIVGGQTKLTIARGLHKLLRKEGIRVAALKYSKLSGRVATMPVTGGQMDPVGALGVLTQDGGLRFGVGRKTVALDRFGISTRNKTVSARIAGKQVPFAGITGFRFSRSGFGNSYEIGALRLTGTAAGLLNRKLGLDGVLKGGKSSFGSIAGTTIPLDTRVGSGAIELAAAQGLYEKLSSIGARIVGFEATPVSQTPPTYRFPLINGVVTLDMRGGFVGAEAGWRIYANFEGPGAVMTLSNMTVHFEMPAVRPLAEMGRLTARMQIHDAAGHPTMIGDVTLGTLVIGTGTQLVDPASRTMTLPADPVKIEPFFVDRLNEVFAAPKEEPNLFAYDEPLGSLSVTLQAH